MRSMTDIPMRISSQIGDVRDDLGRVVVGVGSGGAVRWGWSGIVGACNVDCDRFLNPSSARFGIVECETAEGPGLGTGCGMAAMSGLAISGVVGSTASGSGSDVVAIGSIGVTPSAIPSRSFLRSSSLLSAADGPALLLLGITLSGKISQFRSLHCGHVHSLDLFISATNSTSLIRTESTAWPISFVPLLDSLKLQWLKALRHSASRNFSIQLLLNPISFSQAPVSANGEVRDLPVRIPHAGCQDPA